MKILSLKRTNLKYIKAVFLGVLQVVTEDLGIVKKVLQAFI